MEGISKQFGLIIAYLIPGFIGLVGLVPLVPAIGRWLQPVSQGDLGFGPPVYALLAATALGQIVSCFRWVLLDQFHHLTGLKMPRIDFSQFGAHLSGFDYLVQNHFRYYECSGNTLLAVVWTYSINRFFRTSPFLGVGTDLGMVVFSLVLFAASRDALSRYYLRTRQLVGEVAEKGFRGEAMYNGCDHEKEAGGRNPRPVATKPAGKAVAPPKPQSPEAKNGEAAK
jgi:hypothetical protein